MIGGLGRLYTVTFTAATITAKEDLFYIKPAADKPIDIEMIEIAASGGTADAGDAQEELLDVRLIRLPATVTAGSGGGTPTPTPVSPNDAAAGAVAHVNDTTVATTSGTALTMHASSWNNRITGIWLPAPEHRWQCANAQAIVFRLETAPADSLLVSGTMNVREII